MMAVIQLTRVSVAGIRKQNLEIVRSRVRLFWNSKTNPVAADGARAAMVTTGDVWCCEDVTEMRCLTSDASINRSNELSNNAPGSVRD